MPVYRYPGPRPFEENDIEIFFGRDADKARLLTFINVEQLVVLFAKSGLGKSSLINAAIIPKLREKNYEIIVSRFTSYNKSGSSNGSEYSSVTPLQKLLNEIKNKFATTPTFIDALVPEKNSLWHLFKNIQVNEQGKKTYFIFFDQFEELFTYPASQVKEFKEALSELIYTSVPQEYLDEISNLENDASSAPLTDEQLSMVYRQLPLKILFTIRSDKFSLLTNLKDAIPGIVTKTYELKPFSDEQAKDTIVRPASKEGDFYSSAFSFNEDALKKMMDFLTDCGTQPIELFQLQILCRHVEDIVIKSKSEGKEIQTIKADQLGDIKNIFEDFYNNLISKIDPGKVECVKKLFEEGLIFEKDKIRLSLYAGQIAAVYGIDESLLRDLVNTHILRAEADANGKEKYELSHDSLIGPILKAKEKRMAKESEKENLRKQKEEQQKIISEKEEENIKLADKVRLQRLRTRNQVISITAIIVVLFAVIYYRSEKLDKLRIEFRYEEKDWFNALDENLQTYILRRDFLVLKKEDIIKYDSIKYSYKCAGLALQYIDSNPELALRLAKESFVNYSDSVTKTVFKNIINSSGFWFYSRKIDCPGINNIKWIRKKESIIVTTSVGIYWYSSKDGSLKDCLTDENYRSDYSVFSDNGRYLLYEIGQSGLTHLLDLDTLPRHDTIFVLNKYDSEHFQNTIAFDFSDDLKFFVHGNGDSSASIIDLSGKVLNQFTFPKGQIVNELSVSPDGKYFAAGMNSGKVYLVNIMPDSVKKFNVKIYDSSEMTDPIHNLEHKQQVNSISFSHDSNYVLTGSQDGFVNIWEVKSKRFKQRIPGIRANTNFAIQKELIDKGLADDNKRSVFRCKFSRDDQYIFIGEEYSGKITLCKKGSPKDTSLVDFGSVYLDYLKEKNWLFGLNYTIKGIYRYKEKDSVNTRYVAASEDEICIWDTIKQGNTYLEIVENKIISPLSIEEKFKYHLLTPQLMLSLKKRRKYLKLFAY